MAGLKHRISSSDTLSATEVSENFSAIGDRCNSIPDEAFEGAALTTRHFTNRSIGAHGWSAGIARLKDTRAASFGNVAMSAAPYSDVAGAETPPQQLVNHYSGEHALPVFVWAEISFRDDTAMSPSVWTAATVDINYNFKLLYKTDLTSGWEEIPGMETERKAQAGSTSAPPEEATMVLFGAVSPGGATYITFKLQEFYDGTIGGGAPKVGGLIHSLYVVR
tara:strand:+ start:899 stop:1561 length:663 start_codon:yes stop_codon:yes gene_type:complete